MFPTGAVGLLGPNGAGKSTMIQRPPRLRAAHRGPADACSVWTWPSRRWPIRARIGYMPETDGHIPGMNAVSFVAFCGELSGLPRADAMQRAHEVLFYVGLGEARYRNLETYSTGHETADQAGPGARARPRSAVPRRAHQRHGPQGPRGDADADRRHRPQQGAQRDPLVAPAARRRAHVRARDRARQGRRGHAGAASKGSRAPAAASSSCGSRARRRRFSPRSPAPGSSATTTTTTSCGSSCP